MDWHEIKRATAVVFALAATECFAMAGKLYVTDRAAGVVKAVGLDGTNPTVIADFNDAANTLRGIALDIPNQRFFVADNGSRKIYRVDLDGKNRMEVAGGLSFPADVKIDSKAKKVYWCDYTGNKIQRANFDGSNAETAIETPKPYFLDLDLDLEGQWLYWGDYDNGNIFRVKMAGGEPEVIIHGQKWIRAVNLDLAQGHIYWCDREAHQICRRKIDGGEIEVLYDKLDTPHGMALDIPARKIYWADTGSNRAKDSRGAKSICRGDMDKRGPYESLLVLNEPWDVEIDGRVNSYQEWRARFFPKDLLPHEVDPSSDRDEDGVSNLLEYAFARHPERKETQPLYEVIADKGEDGKPEVWVSFQRFQGCADLVHYVEVSHDSRHWTRNDESAEVKVAGPWITTPLGLDRESVRARVLEKAKPGGKLHARVRVSLKPNS